VSNWLHIRLNGCTIVRASKGCTFVKWTHIRLNGFTSVLNGCKAVHLFLATPQAFINLANYAAAL
jgi:hypothetical protein